MEISQCEQQSSPRHHDVDGQARPHLRISYVSSRHTGGRKHRFTSANRFLIYRVRMESCQLWWSKKCYEMFQFLLQGNLDLVTLNLVTTCDLVTVLQRSFFNLLHKIIRFSDILCNLVTVFAETKSVTKSRLLCTAFVATFSHLQSFNL